MDIYLIRNLENHRYLYMECDAMIRWVEQEEAQVFDRARAYEQESMFAHDGVGVEVVHLIAIRPGIDPYAMTGDGEPIRMGRYYYLPTKRGLDILCVKEIAYQRRGKRSVISIMTDRNALPIKPTDLYQGEAAARRARFEKMADMGMWAGEKDQCAD